MSEWLIPIFVFYLIYLYLTMKKPKISTEKPAPKAKTEQPNATVVTEAKPKKPSPAKKTPNKSQAVATKPEPKGKTELPVAAVVTDSKPKKSSSSIQKSPKKSKSVESKLIVSAKEMAMPEHVGLTAGSIWHYLAENGATSVAKLVRELPEEEKITQRSIGWLAQEGKITLDIINRVEIIGLKG